MHGGFHLPGAKPGHGSWLIVRACQAPVAAVCRLGPGRHGQRGKTIGTAQRPPSVRAGVCQVSEDCRCVLAVAEVRSGSGVVSTQICVGPATAE
jgi:hypothetical protein